MLYWSLKTLFSEPMRLVTSALAVGVSFILVIFFSAVFEGESDQMVLYLKKMQADVWVMQKGVSNMHMASSMVWDWKADKIGKVPGVKEVSAILYLNGPVKIGGKDWFSYIIGISPEYRRAGPWVMAKGKATPGPGEAVGPDSGRRRPSRSSRWGSASSRPRSHGFPGARAAARDPGWRGRGCPSPGSFGS